MDSHSETIYRHDQHRACQNKAQNVMVYLVELEWNATAIDGINIACKNLKPSCWLLRLLVHDVLDKYERNLKT